jgi:YD repeat-containing protein
MRTAAELNLKNNVRSVETHRAHMSTKSYRLLPGGNRELLQDFGDPSSTTESSPPLMSLERLDEQGRVIEDIDVDRPLIDQDPYRRLYTYNDFGQLAEIVDYDESNRVENTWRYAYSVDGKKISEEGWSPTGRLWAREEFDGHENRVRLTWFRDDGAPEREQNCRYQYSREGNVTEQLFFPPEEPRATIISGGSFYTPLQGNSAPAAAPFVYRSLFIRDDDGRLREQVQYWPDGSVNEKKMFDESGVLREKQHSFRAGDLRISKFDSNGRVVQIYAVSPAGFLSSRGSNDVTTFEYDLHGNLVEMNTTASDGTLLRKATNSYRYDEKGNWIERTEVELNQAWQTEPFPASFETICRFTRKLDYFNA